LENNQIMTSQVIKPWERGYKILNRYEIIDVKQGGMGIIYIVQDHEWNRIFAFKTFQDKYIWDKDAIQRFIAEAVIWTELERHTNIVFANFVLKIEGKPLLGLEYIDGGDLNQFIGKFTIAEALDFTIQFCTGMGYAYKKLGVIHRDIKPGNVLVQKNPGFRFGYCYKITDFGLVKALGNQFQDKFVEVSTVIGTLPFMPPEQFPKWIQKKFSFERRVTTRADIYSFGVTLYLLLTGKLPFYDLDGIFLKKPENPRNLNPKIPESLNRLILKCIEKNPDMRYTDFDALQAELIEIYNGLSGESYAVIGKKEELTGIDWTQKGNSLEILGKPREAIECHDKALEINPTLFGVWNNKGIALVSLGKLQEALGCYNQALDINPRFDHAWNNKGIALFRLGKNQEAVECYDKTLEINPRDIEAWYNKGAALASLGKLHEALGCYDKALEISPRDSNALSNKGLTLSMLRKNQEAIECYDKALEINPRDEEVWNNKGFALLILGKLQEALDCCDKVLEINPKYSKAWHIKGIILLKLGKKEEAIICLENFRELDPELYASVVERGKQRKT